MPAWLIIVATTAYMAGLFAVAWRGDRWSARAAEPVSPFVYALALAVYCTSWTYYGAVGTAAASGWTYLPIYLGPALVFALLPGVLRRIGDIARRESVTSLSDFLAARYGKSRTLAAVATIAAVLGSLPYIALQLKSVGMSFQTLASAGGEAAAQPAAETVFFTALALGVFAIMFGARHADTTRRNAGLMHVLALESVIKLAALGAVCVVSLTALGGVVDAERVAAARAQFDFGGAAGSFVTITILSMAAIICLPRQFHVTVIERSSGRDLAVARWLFPIYMALTALVVAPITLAGAGVLAPGASPDLFVLELPLHQGHEALALFVFLGGFSAATGMVIVSSIALSTMITNDLVVPLWMGSKHNALSDDVGRRVLAARRIAIVAVLAMSYGYYRIAHGEGALASIGLLSFAAASQFAPALLGGLYWRRGHRDGATAGIAAGLAMWAYTLALPAVFGADALAPPVLGGLFHPQALLGLELGAPLTHGVVWSLGANIVFYVAFSLRAQVRLRDQVQAVAFASLDAAPASAGAGAQGGFGGASATPNGLRALAERFLAREAVASAFARFELETGVPASGEAPADWRLMQESERLLARVIGAASARVVLASALAREPVPLDDVLSILDQQTIAQRFDRHMLQSMLEHLTQGVSVVDGEQRLVAWNSAYTELFDYPPDLVRVGLPVAELIRHNIDKGWLEGDNPEAIARARIARMRAGAPYSYERQIPGGRFLRITGSPMPGGGYVTTFTDITEDKRREQALIELNSTLEARVEKRTDDLRVMASDLDRARKAAEAADASKTRFLAAASHDLLQPLNAARLFLSAAGEECTRGTDASDLLAKADRAIVSADELLNGLLDISKLDHGDIRARPVTAPAAAIIEDLVDEAEGLAAKAGLRLRAAPTSLAVHADVEFLQSILRNFLSNARRYTQRGGILIGARRRGDRVRFEVWDTGPGVREEDIDVIFEEFRRLEDKDNLGVRGAGLGLAIARRLAEAMGARIGVRSQLGRGSVFFVEVDRAEEDARARPSERAQELRRADGLEGLRVLCVDDEGVILDGLDALLTSWGCKPARARRRAEAVAAFDIAPPDAILVDLQLGDSETGLDVIDALRAKGGDIPAALLTASKTSRAHADALARRIPVFHKPVDPSALRAFLQRARREPSR